MKTIRLTTMLTFALLIISNMAIAQNNPVDFESDGIGSGWSWTVFENGDNPAVEVIANPDASGINQSDSVASITSRTEGATYAGATTRDIGEFTLDTTNSTISIMVWKSKISDVGLKLETASGWAQPEIKVPNTVTNQWEELTFDFSDVPNPPDEPYNGLTIFPDFGERSEDHTTYFDNIMFSEAMGGSEPSDTSLYCGETVTHLGIEAETASAIKLTIENVDAQSMKVSIESANADPVDVLVVNNLNGPITGSPGLSPVDTTNGTLSQVLTWNDTPPAEVELNVLWSKESFEGNWQLSSQNVTIPFTASCSSNGGDVPTPAGDELVTNGDFEAGNDGSWYGEALDIRTEGDNSYFFADVAAAGNPYDVNISQLVELTPGEEYVFSFDASTQAGNSRTMVVGIGQSAAPYYADVETVTLTDSVKTYDLLLAATDDGTGNDFGDANSRVLFDMGADTGIVVIDNVSLKAVNESTSNEEETVPNEFELNQNYPNPFNPTTNISYTMPASGKVTLEVFNIQGQKVATLVNGIKSAGSHSVTFDATNLASGLYIYRLGSANSIQVKKMMLIK